MANINKNRYSYIKDEDLILASRSSMMFGKLFLPDFKKSKNPPAHYETMNTIDSSDNYPIALIACRNFSKTTLTKATILRKLIFAKIGEDWKVHKRRHEHIGWVSSSLRKSQNNTQYVKDMLEYNPIIKWFFGRMRGKKWTSEDISTAYGDRMISTSNLSSLRGDTMVSMETGAERYSFIVADDSENEQNTITENARVKFRENLQNAIMNALEFDQEGNKFVFINTPIHYAGYTQDKIELYQKFPDFNNRLRVTGWKILFYPAISEEDGSLVWPDRLTHEFLDQRRKEIGSTAFYQEYLLQVQSEDDAVLGRKVIKYHTAEYFFYEGQNYIKLNNGIEPVNIFIGCDPATDIKTTKSDYSVIIIIAVTKTNDIYVLHYERHKGIPTVGQRDRDDKLVGTKGVVDYIIDLHNAYHADVSTVEDVAMTRSVMQQLNYRRDIMNRWDIVISPYKPTTKESKLNRIFTILSGRFQNGKIFIRKEHYALENEIITFSGKMAHDDLIDSLHMAVSRAYPPGKLLQSGLFNRKKKKRKVRNWQT